jgi:uncharacterized protein YecE (DUF72 family)
MGSRERTGQLRIGTSGWIYPHWRGVFYPEKLPVQHWFRFYSQSFDTVEINNTFYRLPAPEVFVQWRKQAPPGFLYTVKVSRFLTHMKKLKDPVEPLKNILVRSRKLASHLGPLLYQLPPRWKCDVNRLRDFIAHLPRSLSHVFEFRDVSWCNEEVRALLDETGMAFCIHDMRGFACPIWVTGPLAYLRFHGPADPRHAGRYNLTHLNMWADRIREFLQSGRDVYAYFNNDTAGYAVLNAQESQQLFGIEPALDRE